MGTLLACWTWNKEGGQSQDCPEEVLPLAGKGWLQIVLAIQGHTADGTLEGNFSPVSTCKIVP